MKHISKIFFVGLVALSGQCARAATTLNTDPLDPGTVRVANYTVDPSTRNWTGSVYANAGEIVSVSVYYHDTGSDTAHNVILKLNQPPSGAMSNFTFSGSAVADNAPVVNGSAAVNLTSAQTFAYNGQAFWYPNQSLSPQALPFGQNGTEIFGAGLRLGDIAPGWPAQGSVVLRFQVGGTNTGGSFSTYTYTSQAAPPIIPTVPPPAGPNISLSYPNSYYSSSATGLNNNYYSPYTTTGNSSNLPSVNTNPITRVPAQNTAVLNGFLNYTSNDPSTVWFEWGLGPGLGNRTPSQGITSGSFSSPVGNLSPGVIYYYRAAAQNSAGTAYGGIMTFVLDQSAPAATTTPSFYAPQPPASPASSVSTGGATSRIRVVKEVANLSFPNGTRTSVAAWAGNTIEYSFTVSNTGAGAADGLVLTDPLSPFVIASSTPEISIGHLGPGEVKHLRFRVIAGKFDQNVVAFNQARVTGASNGTEVNRTSNGTIVIINLQPLTLAILTDRAGVAVGDPLTYTVEYKNDGASPLGNAALHLVLPLGTQFDQSTPTMSQGETANSYLLPIGTIPAEGSGSVTVRVKTDKNLQEGSVLTFSAIVTYTDAFSSRQIDVNTYVNNVVENGKIALNTLQTLPPAVPPAPSVPSNLAAVASTGSGLWSFFPQTLLGWFGLTLLIIILVLLIRRKL